MVRIRLALLLSSLLLTIACDPSPMRPDGAADRDSGQGTEECEAPRLVCGSQCVDPVSDPRHCGECNNRCPAGGFCSSGMCSMSCAAPLTTCGEACVDLATSASHCGDCDQPCNADQMCMSGGCVCASGLSDCGGNCVDRMSSNLHCGRCDNPCGAGEACVSGMCQATAESDCTDGVDNDMDNDTDCADSDCFGTERDCTCPGGMVGMNPTETCEMGTWGTCGPCGPAPDCSPSNPCAYGFNCVSEECVFNPAARFDLILVDAPFIPTNTYGGGTWDSFGGSPDVYVEMRTMRGVSGPQSGTDDNTLMPVWNERLFASVRASELIAYLEVRVRDHDPVGGDDNIGDCTLALAERHFNGMNRTWTCGRNDSAMTPGWRIRIRLEEP